MCFSKAAVSGTVKTLYEIDIISNPAISYALLPTNAQIAIVYHPDVTRFMDWGTIRFALDAQRMTAKVSKK